MKNIFLILLNLPFILSQTCFTKNDIVLNGYTYYNSNVYDLTLYKTHPAGNSILNLAKGKDMGEIFKNPKYSFHIGKLKVDKDLLKIFIGVLQDNCDISNHTLQTTTPQLPVITEKTITTKIINTEIFTTQKGTIYDPIIVINNSENIKNNFYILFLSFLFLHFLL